MKSPHPSRLQYLEQHICAERGRKLVRILKKEVAVIENGAAVEMC
jgi:hypothetical protein